MNKHEIHRRRVNNFTDGMHRPAQTCKFKVSGCPNDCMNAIERAGFSVIDNWCGQQKSLNASGYLRF